MAKHNLLFEIGCEELPTHAVKPLADQLADRLTGHLILNQLISGEIISTVFATPRRIGVYVENVAAQLPAQIIERQGPAYQQAFDAKGNPTPAATGFAQSCGVEVADLSIKDTPKGQRLYYRAEVFGKKTIDILPELIQQVLNNLQISRPMRWGEHTESFARPVHWILALFGDQIIPGTFFDIKTSNRTFGHRFHHPDTLIISDPSDYEKILLEKGRVIPIFKKRQDKIKELIHQITPVDCKVEMDPDLLDEVSAVVEWPVALTGQFNPEFLKVPAEALITSMKINQKYFPILNNQGQLQSKFVLISNIERKDSSLIIHGNERVLNARLSDAAFFYHNDLQHSLESRLPHLEQVVFQMQLGSIADKTERMVNLGAFIAQHIAADVNIVKQAAQLSKCDLLSEMVGEFPTLQGVMGYYYAKNDGLNETCALAIKEHYYPRFAGDQIPNAPESCAVALADKIDTLVGIFGINQPPTGDKDPFALRRAANGILNMIIANKFPLDMMELLHQSQQTYSIHLPNVNLVDQVFDFLMNRLKSISLEKNVSAEQFEAVLACRPTKPLDFINRLEAVQKFQRLPEAASLAAANKRVSNILKKQDKTLFQIAINQHLFEYPEERVLAQKLAEQTQNVQKLYQEAKYVEALEQLASLKEPVDTFFDKVLVMTEDEAKRKNRLALLNQLHTLFTQVADISML